ncbi:uncharacterized protein BT62DRAFT_57394 [Guyanagaster necrorhizus]|uniref:Uncharacterized protein n=1 Tax=Guyanagaster necrorhizus TaxID=856835 RepID=A0A9P7W6Z1_9AGAR|nr:uncharacterized protein BT62DRAFT_57394 [Guyanagaster necrorhizus MCA 3950]KAG7453278.1 hypothetical protein BT62DRAFT_57394 [Guyanagaster necrorhizus MCA 3950]
MPIVPYTVTAVPYTAVYHMRKGQRYGTGLTVSRIRASYERVLTWSKHPYKFHLSIQYPYKYGVKIDFQTAGGTGMGPYIQYPYPPYVRVRWASLYFIASRSIRPCVHQLLILAIVCDITSWPPFRCYFSSLPLSSRVHHYFLVGPY